MGDYVNNRLEGVTRGTDLLPGLSAQVHDALWLLARQWQLGEFDGADAGSPISATTVVRTTPLAAWQPSGGAFQPIGQQPLEALAESDGGPLTWPDRVAAGLRLARALHRAGVDPKPLIAAYPLRTPDPAVDPDASPAAHATSAVTPTEVAAIGALTEGRVVDAEALAADLATSLAAVVTKAGSPAAGPVLTAWQTWWDSRQPIVAGPWNTTDFTYDFTAATADASVPHFQASRFEGGTLDWFSFDLSEAGAATKPSTAAGTAKSTAIPVPVTFHGSPVGRYWQLEDAQTDFGAIETYPTELGKLLLAEFTACFAGDWFRVPARVPYGAAARVDALVSTDTFGVRTLVPAADTPSAANGTRPWRMFEHSSAAGQTTQSDNGWLLIPPALAATLDSDPAEEVVLLRDPAADLCWGIENIVANAVDRPVRRSEDLNAQHRESPPDPREGLANAWVWRLQTTVPENWIPLLPTRGRSPDEDYQLVQGAMIRYSRNPDGTLSSVPILPASLLLRDGLLLPEREVPREGLVVRRNRRSTRRLDGRRVTWWSHFTSIGHGEGSSGLAYDGVHENSSDPRSLGQ